jgi:hypothetical protein
MIPYTYVVLGRLQRDCLQRGVAPSKSQVDEGTKWLKKSVRNYIPVQAGNLSALIRCRGYWRIGDHLERRRSKRILSNTTVNCTSAMRWTSCTLRSCRAVRPPATALLRVFAIRRSAREGSIKVGPGAPLATVQAHAGQVDKPTSAWRNKQLDVSTVGCKPRAVWSRLGSNLVA